MYTTDVSGESMPLNPEIEAAAVVERCRVRAAQLSMLQAEQVADVALLVGPG